MSVVAVLVFTDGTSNRTPYACKDSDLCPIAWHCGGDFLPAGPENCRKRARIQEAPQSHDEPEGFTDLTISFCIDYLKDGTET